MKKLKLLFSRYWRSVILIALSLTPILWFFGRGNIVIDGVDTNFPLNPVAWFLRRLYVWNSINNGGSDFSASTAGLFFHLIQVGGFYIFHNLQQVEMFSLIFWFAILVFSSYLLARQLFSKSFLAQLTFVVFYCFNIYIFNTWENVKVANLSLLGAIPLGLLALILFQNKARLSTFLGLSLAASIILSGAGINPAYFICFFLILFLYMLSQVILKRDCLTLFLLLKGLLALSIIILLVNSYWILPTAKSLLFSTKNIHNIQDIGFTNWLDSLSEHTSLLNILRLQGAWDWYAVDQATGMPLYIPYANNYFNKSTFLLFSFGVMMLVLVGLAIKRRRILACFWGILLIVGVFFGAGSHPPTGTFYNFLGKHIPFFSFFRSPWYIFTPLLTLAIAGSLGMLVETILTRVSALKEYVPSLIEILTPRVLSLITKRNLSVLVILFVIANLVYAYPLLTGRIFRPGRYDSFFVKFPSYIFDAQKWLASSPNVHPKRIIGYPDDQIENYTWGYRGVDSILSLLTDAEVLYSPLNEPNAPLPLIIKDFYQLLQKGNSAASSNIAKSLDISLILDKGDQSSLAQQLPPVIKTLPNTQFGAWNFYSYDASETAKIYSPREVYSVNSEEGQESIFLGFLGNRAISINASDNFLKKKNDLSSAISPFIFTNNSQKEDSQNFLSISQRLKQSIDFRNLAAGEYTFSIKNQGLYEPSLERYALESYGIDPASIDATFDGVKTVFVRSRDDDSYVTFNPIYLTQGQHVININLKNPNLIPNGNFESLPEFKQDSDGTYQIAKVGDNQYLSIINRSGHDVSAKFHIAPIDQHTNYLIQLRYKSLWGENPRLSVYQSNKATPLKVLDEQLPKYPDWSTYSIYFDPIRTDSYFDILLKAPPKNDELGTTVFYDDLSVQRVFSNQLFLRSIEKPVKPLSVPIIYFDKKSPVLYQGTVDKAYGSHIIAFSENYSPDWKMEITFPDGTKYQAKDHFTANSFANAWIVSGMPIRYNFKIWYDPQKYFNWGAGVSLLTVLGLLGFMAVDIKRRKV